MSKNCYRCGYHREECSGEGTRNYCNDLDCYVDPYEPPCSDENYNS